MYGSRTESGRHGQIFPQLMPNVAYVETPTNGQISSPVISTRITKARRGKGSRVAELEGKSCPSILLEPCHLPVSFAQYHRG